MASGEHQASPVQPDYRPIHDYGLVGNSQSAALVATDGSVEWLCLPHFDSPAVLFRLLDARQGGFLRTLPTAPIQHTRRRYRDRSAVLETTLSTDAGELLLTDAMPVTDDQRHAMLEGLWGGHGKHRLVRRLMTHGPAMDVTVEARLAFDFGATPSRIELQPGRGALIEDDGRYLALIWPGELRQDDDGVLHGTLTLEPEHPVACVLAYEEDAKRANALFERADWDKEIEATDVAWQDWATCLEHRGPYADALVRSAVTLKLLSFEPTGAFVAAPTTSLPEVIGGVRNWDYRYCWLRDSTLTLYALILGGDYGAARAYLHWIGMACGGQAPSDIQIMYGINGERDLPERTLDRLSGYRDSSPVRVGNAAAKQRQSDVYGEVLDAVWFAYQHAGNAHPLSIEGHVWELLRAIADYICEIWREPDHGLWEMRQEPRHFVYSKLMCWVGLDRALKLSQAAKLPADTERWTIERDAIRADLLEHGYNTQLGAFTMAYNDEALDAAALRIPLVGFLPADDPRIISTIEQIQSKLRRDGLVLRYEAKAANDGLPDQEGAFAMCSFWLIDCLTALGKLDEARAMFERMLGYANDLGLYSEEIDPTTGEALGNYPQAFTHLALISSGVDLTEALRRQQPLPGDKSQRATQVKESRGQGKG